MLPHQALLLDKQLVNFLLDLIDLGLHGLHQLLFLVLECLRLLTVLSDLILGYFPPFLEEFNVVLLCFLFDHLVIFIHFSHQLDMPLVHLGHVLLDLQDVRFRKLHRDEFFDGRPVETIFIIRIKFVIGLVSELI